jgi:hypothetical protein
MKTSDAGIGDEMLLPAPFYGAILEDVRAERARVGCGALFGRLMMMRVLSRAVGATYSS